MSLKVDEKDYTQHQDHTSDNLYKEIDSKEYLIIEPNRVQTEYFKDLYRYRDLFYFLIWRDLLVRYKQAFFGVAWALIRPILNMALFALIFGKIASLPSQSVSYPLFVFAGMLPWQLFSNCLMDASNSMLSNATLVSKIYFPRVLLPTSFICVNMVDFLISFALLLIMMMFSGDVGGLSILAFPLFLVQILILTTGLGLWMAALTVRYRDFRFILPFVVQFGMFLSPVGYGTFVLPEKWQWFFFLNPLVGIIDGFRWALFGVSYPLIGVSIGLSLLISIAILYSGFSYFRKMERIFADII